MPGASASPADRPLLAVARSLGRGDPGAGEVLGAEVFLPVVAGTGALPWAFARAHVRIRSAAQDG